MKYVHLLLSVLLLGCWIFFGNYPGPAGLPVPALGEFFNPAKGFWHNSAADRRSGERRFEVDHPLAGGEVFFDERGVPHIFANSLEVACFLQGFVHAADRLWQMDISTRATEGRLSEILGARTQVRDKDQVRRGFRRAARNQVDTIRKHFPQDLRYTEAYAAGVNAWIDRLAPEDYPVEYKILDHQPLRWSPYRTALLAKGMSQSLSGRYRDATSATTLATFGPDVYDELFPKRCGNRIPTLVG
ncbi:MAG: penicillin acylase family protein, partial [Bacteroidota bacterium]